MAIRDEIWIQPYQAPCGSLLLGACRGKLCLCNWEQERHPGRVMARLRAFYGVESRAGTTEVTDEAARQLDDYFARRRTRFDLPLQFIGTDFQKSVWRALLDIPYGQTASYRELAVAIGAPSAVRAVANANGPMPFPSSFPATVLLAPTIHLPGMPVGSMPKDSS